MILQYLASIPPETWGLLATGGATVIAGFAKVTTDFKKREKKNLLKVAIVIAKTTHESIEDSLERRHHTRNALIDATRNLLSDYGSTVTRTSRSAVEQMVCNEQCTTIDLLCALYADCVLNTFMTDVLNFFIREVISKNGFRERTERQIESLIDDVRSRSFSIFLGSMRRRFRHEKIQLRVDWIEKNMDHVFMRKLVSDIIYECRDISEAHYKTGEEKAKELPQKIMRELVA